MHVVRFLSQGKCGSECEESGMIRFGSEDRIFRQVNKNGLPCLVFQGWEQYGFQEHLFTTREGGVSEGIYASLNLGFGRGDDPERVLTNYRRVAQALGGTIEDMVCSDQTHTSNIRIVTAEDRGIGVVVPRDYTDIDGLLTNEPGIILGCFFADCVPLYFLDPVERVVGICHSGWRGTVAQIGAAAVEKMEKTYGCLRENIVAGIGPSICGDCYEIGEDVAEAFMRFPFRDAILKKDTAKPGAEQKYHLNLWETNRRILLAAGLSDRNVYVTNLCTCCNHESMFSHRGSGGKRGNLGAFIRIRTQK